MNHPRSQEHAPSGRQTTLAVPLRTVWVAGLLILTAACGHDRGSRMPFDSDRGPFTVVDQWISALDRPCRRIRKENLKFGDVTQLQCREQDRWIAMRDLAAFGRPDPEPTGPTDMAMDARP